MQVILSAMKKYGLIMADNGSAMYISGAPDSRWDNDDLHNLGQVPASAFEVVQMNPVYTASNVPQGAAPSITSFTAAPSSVSAGGSATLSWDVSNASYVIISPQTGSGARHQRDGAAQPNHYLHALRHQPVRTHHGDSHSKRAVRNAGASSRAWGICLHERGARAYMVRTIFPGAGDFRMSRYWPGRN